MALEANNYEFPEVFVIMCLMLIILLSILQHVP